MNNIVLNFAQWISEEKAATVEMVGTGVVFNPKIKANKHSDWNMWGTPGLMGTTPKENPIGCRKKKK